MEDIKIDNIIPYDKLDELYNVIDMLDKEEIKKIMQYCIDQQNIVHLLEKRRKNLANLLRIERIKFRKELNEMKKQLEESISESEEIKPKKSKAKK